MRNAPDKQNCLVLDFAGNIKRHGPIDRVNPYDSSRNGKGEAPVKTCPQCRSVIFAGYRHCPDCGHEFPPPESELKPTATSRPIISQAAPFWVKVEKISYERHRKLGKPDSLRVNYHESLYSIYSEWVCLEHGGRVAQRAHRWWVRRGGDTWELTVA
jgi:DNA repair protein RadD